jgi:hypothetical protein
MKDCWQRDLELGEDKGTSDQLVALSMSGGLSSALAPGITKMVFCPRYPW